MFLVGLDLDPTAFRGKGYAAVLTSHVSIVTPIFLGAALSLLLYPRLSNESVSFVAFALFVGTTLSVTAFPVLARLLAEHRLEATGLGRLAIACAAIDDVTAWCLLAGITTLTRHGASIESLLLSIGGVVVYTLVMFKGVARVYRWIVERKQRDGQLGHPQERVIILQCDFAEPRTL
jgi:Kef-type K+ transport system membrane component KefB